jgi:hypothetical protein
MTETTTKLWIDELDPRRKAALFGGLPWDVESEFETPVSGLRSHTFVLPSTRGIVVDLGTSADPRAFQRYFDEMVVFASAEDLLPTQAEVLQVLENIRQQLGLNAETMAALLGAKVRSYYNWLGGTQMPFARLIVATRAGTTLGAIVASDPTLAKRIFDTTPEAASQLIATGQLASWKALVDRARAEQSLELQAVRQVLPIAVKLPEGETPQTFAATVKSAAFRAAAALLERLAPQTHATSEIWRAEAYTQLDAMLDTRASGEELPEEWVFLTTMTGPGLDELRERAHALLEDPHSTSADWDSFVAEEGERAWDSYSFEPLGPLEDAMPTAATAPQRLLDFTNLGLDLVTGEARTER